jgi:leucyl-tRNA synthetase
LRPLGVDKNHASPFRSDNVALILSVHTMSFPTYDESLISTGTKTIVVQVNGKKRAMFEISEDMGEEEVYVKALELLKGKLEENDIKKKIYIKGKIVSFVV